MVVGVVVNLPVALAIPLFSEFTPTLLIDTEQIPAVIAHEYSTHD
jgi:hypothetical protein